MYMYIYGGAPGGDPLGRPHGEPRPGEASWGAPLGVKNTVFPP